MKEEPMDSGAGEMLHEGGSDSGREDTYFLPKGALPEGMQVNSGDILEFKVVGQDKDGNVEVEYNHGDDKGEEGQSWQDEMRQNVKGADSSGPMTEGGGY